MIVDPTNPIQVLDLVSTTLVGAVCLSVPPAHAISRRHPRELYVLSYIFSLFFLLFLALNVGALRHQVTLESYLGDYAFIYRMLTDTDDELLLVASIIYFGIFPQLLTYVISGMFGSASSPLFVRQLQTFAVLSLLKFLIGLGAIRLATFAASFGYGKAVPDDLIVGSGAVSFGLIIAAFHFCGSRWYVKYAMINFLLIVGLFIGPPFLLARALAWRFLPSRFARRVFGQRRSGSMRRVKGRIIRFWRSLLSRGGLHRFFTRNVPKPPPEASAKRAEPAGSSLVTFDVNISVPMIDRLRSIFAEFTGKTETEVKTTKRDGHFSFKVDVNPSLGDRNDTPKQSTNLD